MPCSTIRLIQRPFARSGFSFSLIVAAFAVLLTCHSVQAASQAWDGDSLINGNFSTGTNWLGDLVPGSTSLTNSTDVATFNAAIANGWGTAVTPIIIDSTTQNISGLSFTGAAGNYVIGTTGGNALKLSNGGTIQILSDLTATNAIETINAPLALQGTSYTLANNSANGTGAGAGTLNFGGGITGVTGNTVLSLSGTNTNANTISGSIGNGTATSLAIAKNGEGTWTLSGANNYTGLTTVSYGVLNIQHASALGLAALGTSIDGGAALQLQGGITTLAEALTLRGSGISSTGALRNLSGNNDYAGLVTLGSAARINSDAGTLTLSHSGTITGSFGLTVGGAGHTTINSILGTGNRTLTKDGSGTLTLNGASTFTGATTVWGGTLKAGVASVAGVSGAFGINSAVTLANVAGVTLDITGFNTQIGALSGGGSSGGNVTLGAATLTVDGWAPSAAFAGVISGTGGLTRSGAGSLILSGANTYTGATTISSGTLQLGSGGTTGSLATSSAITNNGTLVFNRSNAVAQGTDFATVISGTGVVTQNGPGTLTLSGANTYTGATNVNGGTLVLAFGTVSSNIISSSSALTLDGGTLQLTGSGTQQFNGLTTGSNGSRILLGANQTLTLGALTSAGYATALNFNTAAGGANGATVGSGIVVLTGQTAGNAINAGFTVSDSGGFGLATVNGSDQVVRLLTTMLLPVSGATATTDYRIDNNAGGSAAAGSSTLAITASQAANSITVDTSTANGAVTLASGAVLSSNTWNFGGTGSNTWQISGSAGGAGLDAVAYGDAIDINNYASGTITFSSPILASGSNVTVKGTGTTVFAGANTYSGATYIRSGTLEVATGGSITTAAASMTVGSFNGENGTLNLTGGAVSNSYGYVGHNAGSSGTATVSSGTWTNSNTLYIGVYGTGVLNITGGTVSNAQGYIGSDTGGSGTVTVSSGSWTNSSTLYVGNSGTGVLNVTGGAVSNLFGRIGTLAGSNGTATVSSGTWTNSNGLIVGQSGTGVLNVTGGAVSNTDGYLGYNTRSSGTATVSSGTWTNSGNLNVGYDGTGVLTITGSGEVNAGGVGLGSGSGSAGTLNLGTGGTAGTLNAGTVAGGSGAAVVNFNHTGNYTFAPVLAGTLAVNKLGAGTTTLTGANTYTGGSTITGGTLNVTNTTDSATGTGSVTVETTGTLSGTGLVTTGSNNYIYLNGTLQVGDSTLVSPVASHLSLATSGMGSTVLGTVSYLKFDLFRRGGDLTGTVDMATAADYIALTGSLDAILGGTLYLNDAIAGAHTFAVGDKWKLFDLTSGSITGTLALNYSSLLLTGGLTGSFDNATGEFSIVPEPSRALLLLVGLCTVGLRRRRH